MSSELPPKYIPKDIEPSILDRWNDSKAFAANPDDEGSTYCIVIPPPNVTAALHMGHALNNTLQDILIRHHRMLGDNTLWMPGTDHAGIATQTVVEKRVLAEEGKKRTDFGREEFVAKIQKWKDEYEERITDQLKAMGCSCDWDRRRFTMDPICTRAVREAFFQLFKDGLIYRGKRLVNWDPVTQTALADDEVEMEEVDGHFFYLRYPLMGPPIQEMGIGNYITVATTRPETMLGDTAIAINPKDPRAPFLKGRMVLLPIVNRIIPIVEDDYVVLPVEFGGDPADSKAQFATGFLKVTPAHDPNDYEIGRRHNLPVINVMAPDASISKDHGWPAVEWTPEWEQGPNDAHWLLGKSRKEASKLIVSWFDEHQMLEAKKPYRHSVGHSYRSHAPIEPYLSDQWYVKVTDDRLAGAANRALSVEQRSPKFAASQPAEHPHRTEQEWEGSLHFYPARYANNFEFWHSNIRDWCISRQLWWGHRIPVWTLTWGHKTNDMLIWDLSEVLEHLNAWIKQTGIADQVVVTPSAPAAPGQAERIMICTRTAEADERLAELASIIKPFDRKKDTAYGEKFSSGPNLVQMVKDLEQDPDVLDTWFSSALWPISTMGWPDDRSFPETHGLLERFNPGNVLCTAREIITLWVSRMVMFNLYLRNCLPFTDVFVHAMIQDGHGQKMSKSLGNGVDPLDIIHSHGSDAMRFTLASMTTQTQDVRLPVNMIDPFSSEPFNPKYITNSAGYVVAAPVQTSPTDATKKFASSYGAAIGDPAASALVTARNTSEKFDFGRNFANKLWNAVRFALSNLETPAPDPNVHVDEAHLTEGFELHDMSLADKWILSRLAATVRDVNTALGRYEFSNYAQIMYDFIWRDFCDWYIEAVKPTVKTSPVQRRVLSLCIDAMLRMLHPVMPFITEKLWEKLNDVAPFREISGVALTPSVLLIHAAWPQVSEALINPAVDERFVALQESVAAIRETRTAYKVPPRQKVKITAKVPPHIAQRVIESGPLLETLANVELGEFGPIVDRPEDAAVTMAGEKEFYLHGLVDRNAEIGRLKKRRDELVKQIAALEGRLSNQEYLNRAPEKLVNESKAKLADLIRELAVVEAQLKSLEDRK